mgnify:FL=1
MRVEALSLGKPITVEYNGKPVETGFYKEPVSGGRMVRRLNIDGDQQADLKLHGGADKAVYAFPGEHYAFYENHCGPGPFKHGHFGENLTTAGLLEDTVRIGDRYLIGKAVLEVTQPRSPCFKFGIRMGAREAIQTCLNSGKTGFYFRVIEEGILQAGDNITLVASDADAPTVLDTHRLYYFDKMNVAALQRAVKCNALKDVWKAEFAGRLAGLGIAPP